MAVSVVVPTYQRRDSIPATIGALFAQDTDRPFEIIVVDNGSTDGTARLLDELAADDERLRILRIDVNRGPGPARNAGWRTARAPLVAFTDDDCVPAEGWLDAVLDAFDHGAELVMGPTVPDPGALAEAGPFSHWVNVRDTMPWFPTCNIAYRRALLERLDGFDESFTARFGSSFGDDTDLGWRALERGADARFVRQAKVTHEVTDSSFRSWFRARRRRGGVPAVVARHPGLRAQLPHPLVYKRAHPPALVAAMGIACVAVAPRRRWAWALAVLLSLPYVRFRVVGPERQMVAGARSPWAVAGYLIADLVEIAVLMRHSRRSRTFVL